MKILIAEDEISTAKALKVILEKSKFSVDIVHNGNDAWSYIQAGPYEVIVLDIMMPGMSGLEVLSSLRKKGCTTPVLLLTAKNEVEDRIEGLDLGADDYLAKPFAMGELLARVRAMLRRRDEFRPDIKTFGDISLNPHSYELSRGEKSVVLPKLEYQMMEVLIINRGIYLSSEDLLEKVWGYDSEADIGSVWVYISYLRKRLSGLGSRVTIRAKRNIGYRLEE